MPPASTWRGCIPAICRSTSALAEQLRRLDAARHSLYADARRAGLRRRRGGAGMRTDRAGSRAKRGAHARLRPRLAHAGEREARDIRGERRDARHPSRDPRHRHHRRGADAVLRRRLPGRRRGAGKLAGAAHPARHARRHRRKGRRGADRAHGAHPRRPRARRTRIFATARSTTPIIAAGSVEARHERTLKPSRNGARPTRFARDRTPRSRSAMSRPATTRAAVCCAARATASPSAMPSAARQRKGFRGGVGRHDARAQRRRAAGRAAAKLASSAQIDFAALGMQIGEALRELGHLGDAAGDGDARHRMCGADI